jgi:hypothetical protein
LSVCTVPHPLREVNFEGVFAADSEMMKPAQTQQVIGAVFKRRSMMIQLKAYLFAAFILSAPTVEAYSLEN